MRGFGQFMKVVGALVLDGSQWLIGFNGRRSGWLGLLAGAVGLMGLSDGFCCHSLEVSKLVIWSWLV
jgi:hypothetical protein